jgi:uroporphyrin-III C-methyltransferase/precorrin-2 dehydrogenase/sirohydrochlorin ferrochelatase
VVVADRLAPRALLDELAPDVELIDAAKVPYGRSLAQEAINDVLIDRARQGKFVVRLKGGDPFVFGRGGEEMIACARAGIPVLVVPGITSAVAVPAAAGVPVTHRGVSQEFHVVSVHVAPDDPQSTVDWPAMARSEGTLVLLMGVERLSKVTEALLRDGRSPETPVMVVQDGTLPTQRAVVAPLSTVADRVSAAGIRPPAIIIVGDVVRVGQEVEMVRAERLP